MILLHDSGKGRVLGLQVAVKIYRTRLTFTFIVQ